MQIPLKQIMFSLTVPARTDAGLVVHRYDSTMWVEIFPPAESTKKRDLQKETRKVVC